MANPAPPAPQPGVSLGDQGSGWGGAVAGAPTTNAGFQGGSGGGWGGAAGSVGQGGQGNQGQFGTVSSDTDDPNKALNDPRWQGPQGWTAQGMQAPAPSAFTQNPATPAPPAVTPDALPKLGVISSNTGGANGF